MNKRLNITLPEQTVQLMDRVAGKGQRSSLIDRAVRRYVKEETRANIRKQLTENYQASAAIDLQLAEERFPLEDEACSTDPRRRSPKAISSSVISSVIALGKPANGRERTKEDERIRKR